MKLLLAQLNTTILQSNFYLKTHSRGKDRHLIEERSFLALIIIKRRLVKARVCQQHANQDFAS